MDNIDWESEAKRAFWAGLEIGATFGSCAILPRWNEYIAKRKSELPAPNAQGAAVQAEPVAWMCANDPDSSSAFYWKSGGCKNCYDSLIPLYAHPLTPKE